MAEYIEREALIKWCKDIASYEWNAKAAPISWADAYESFADGVEIFDPADVVTRDEYEVLLRRFRHLLESDYIRSFDEVDSRTGEYKRDIKESVPVARGRWILRGRKILCSCCKAVFEEVNENELFEVKADLPYLCEIEKYCFNCGAKMEQ